MSGGAGRGRGRRTTMGIVVAPALLTGALGWAASDDLRVWWRDRGKKEWSARLRSSKGDPTASSPIGDDLPTLVGEDLYLGGRPAHRWTPDGGVAEIGLPVPANSTTFQVDDGTVVLVTARPFGSRCRLVVRVAAPEVTQWSAPLNNPERRSLDRHATATGGLGTVWLRD